jgi:hypothetical protein
MSVGKTIGAIVGSFVFVSGTSYLIHQVLLHQDYMDTANTWREPADITHRMWAILLANLVYVIGAVIIYSRGVENKAWPAQGIRFGILLALVTTIYTSLSNWAVLAIPHMLAVKWICMEGIQCLLLGLLIAAIMQPESATA